VVHAADAVSLNPSGVQQGLAVAAVTTHQKSLAAVAAVQGELLTKDRDEQGLAVGEAFG
jgi:hypothetical protein